jgi:uncharacterized membrane protein HdeD (DUF308 family)
MPEEVTVVAGIVVPSVSPLFLSIVAVHIVIALIAVLSGLIAMLSAKRAGRHPRYGKLYFCSLCGVFGSASVLSFMRWAENYPLFIIGASAFAMAFVARTAVRARWRAWPRIHLIGMGSSYVLLLIAFYIDNGKNLPLWRDLPPVSYWAIPTAIGIPLILRALLRHPLTRPKRSGAEVRG